jgi:ubiquinol-cytochrome c reductase subunit 7
MVMPAPSLVSAVVKRPWLTKLLTPLAGWYANAAGYRQMGLR